MNNRLSKFKKLLFNQSLDAAVISSVSDIIYLTNFSGFSNFSSNEREGFLLITQNENYITTDTRYSHAVKNKIKGFNLLELSHQTNLEKILKEIVASQNIKTLGIDTHNLTIAEHNKIKIKKTKHIDLSSLRIIKDDDELEKIKKACQIGDKAFTFILTKIKEGFSEKRIAFELEQFIRKHDCDISFPTIIAFQENAAVPHHKTGNRILKKNEFVLLDFGVKYENYCSDMTRTIFLGIANKEQKQAYQTVSDAQQKAISYLQSALSSLTFPLSPSSFPRKRESMATNLRRRDIIASILDKTAREYILSLGYPSIPHNLGHGIGLEVHEAPGLSPKSKDKLKNGMVFSIEPGIYIPDKFGIRIEDLFTIQNNKLIQLTKSPKNFIEV